METVKIFTKNALFQKFEVLKTNRNKRYKYNEFIFEGVKNINEAIKNNWEIKSFVYEQNAFLSDWAKDILAKVKRTVDYQLTKDLMSEISGKVDTSEIMAIAKMREDNFDLLQFSDNPLIALFDRPSNKGNLGTMIRSCDALGVDFLILTGHGVDLYDPDVILSSMGSFFKVPVIRVPNQDDIKNIIDQTKGKYSDFKVLGTTAHKEKAIYNYNLKTPVMFMIGNETHGLSNALTDLCDDMVTIPMDEFSHATSFNVSCAATVMFYEVVRQRKEN